MTTALDRVTEKVMRLTAEERERLLKVLNSLLATTSPHMTQGKFEQRLLEKSIVSRIPPRIRDADYYANRKPIEVLGKPVSEIMIEERR